MDDPNISMQEYIKLQAEKAQRRIHYTTIIYNDAWKSNVNVPSKPHVSIYNAIKADIDFSISLPDSDDEDFTFICDTNLFSYKLVHVNDLKPKPSTPSLIYTAYPLPNTPYLPLDQKDKLFYVLISFNFADIALPPRDQRHQYLRFEGLEYSEGDIADFKERLGKIYGRGAPHELERVYYGYRSTYDEGDKVRWIWCIMDRECKADPLKGGFKCLLKGDLSAYQRGILSEGHFLSIVSSYTVIRDLMLRLCHRGMDIGSVNIHYLLARYLRRFESGRKRRAMISGGEFVARLAKHYGLLTEQRLYGLTVIVVPGPERQPNVVVVAPKVVGGAPIVDEGALAVQAPVQAPPATTCSWTS
uniref:Uncharacterized protein n=1 Tax=Tanacetum cinerariifolium TaxID=118510 RepID=A0A699I0P4_TANCI|nr:hypothetical protein [Tanacetum cinerariifolium]